MYKTIQQMKKFKIKTFGMLTEIFPSGEFEFPHAENTGQLLRALEEAYPQLKTVHFSLAVDKQVIQEEIALSGKEEIALLPPFSGG